jgi:hypothetical protein
MYWRRLRYENGMSHVVSDNLLLAVQEAMDRATPPGVFERNMRVDAICLEQGGPCYTNRPYEAVMFCDLTIRIPCEDLQPLLLQWRTSPRTTALGQDFYRFASWPWQCLAVTPEQRADLLDLFHARVGQAQDRSVAFWANRKSPQEVLHEHYAHKGVNVLYEPDKRS